MSQLPPPPDDSSASGSTPPPPSAASTPPPAGSGDGWSGTPPAGGYGQAGSFGPRATMSPSEERGWAMAAHLSALIMVIGIPSLIGPLAVWLLKKDQSPFVDDQGKESLNFNISVLLYVIVGSIIVTILAIVTLGLGLIILVPIVLVAAVAWLVLTIVAAVRASEGQAYRYPLTIRFIK